MAGVLEKSLHTALLNMKKMVPSAIPGAERAFMELAPSAGNTVSLASVMMALSVLSLKLMAVVSAMPSGMKINVSEKILILAARNGVLSGIPSAELTSTTLLAAFVHLIALLVRQTLAFHARRIPMVVEPDIHFNVNLTKK
jgi:hypothetical protein